MMTCRARSNIFRIKGRFGLAVILLAMVSTAPLLADDLPVTAADAARLAPVEYRHRLIQQLSIAGDATPAWIAAIDRCEPQRREGVAFLLSNMPADDLRSLSPDRLLHEIDLAYEARATTLW